MRDMLDMLASQAARLELVLIEAPQVEARPSVGSHAEVRRCVWPETGTQLIAHLVAARADRRANRCQDPRRFRAAGHQGLKRAPGDAGRAAAPAGMHRSGQVRVLVHEQDRHAIGGLDSHEHACRLNDGCVGSGRSHPWSLDDLHAVHLREKVDASDRHERVSDGAAAALPRNTGSRRQADLKAVAELRHGGQ